MIHQFEIMRDEQGYAMAICVDGWILIHFERGTVRNEENAGKLMAVLNTAVAYTHRECGVGKLREALEAIMPGGENKGYLRGKHEG